MRAARAAELGALRASSERLRAGQAGGGGHPRSRRRSWPGPRSGCGRRGRRTRPTRSRGRRTSSPATRSMDPPAAVAVEARPRRSARGAGRRARRPGARRAGAVVLAGGGRPAARGPVGRRARPPAPPAPPRRLGRRAAASGRPRNVRTIVSGRPPSAAPAATYRRDGGGPGGPTPIDPPRHLSSESCEHAVLRPSARPLRVLAARRRVQDRRARRARGGVRPAGARPDRPRRHERRGRALQGVPEARRQADPRLRDLPRRRPRGPQPRRAARARAQPPHAAGRERRRLPQPRQALLRRLPRGPAPRQADVDMGQLAAHAEGVIALTGLPGLPLLPAPASTTARPRRARTPTTCSQVFGPENVYFEVQKNGIADQDKANEGIVRIAREVGRPLVGTGDVHYLRREDYHHHTALLCVQTKSTLAAPKMTFDTNEFYLSSSEEMAEAFAEWPEALAVDARDRRALRRRDRARQAAHPALPAPRARTSAPTCARASRRACGGATATRSRPRRSSASRWSSASSTGWASTPTS